MAQYNETRSKTFQVSAALKDRRLVRINAGKLEYAAAASTDVIGVTTKETFAADQFTPIDLLNAQGTLICTAAGGITKGAVVNQAADGKVQAGAGTVRVGIAMETVTTDLDFVEVMPLR